MKYVFHLPIIAIGSNPKDNADATSSMAAEIAFPYTYAKNAPMKLMTPMNILPSDTKPAILFPYLNRYSFFLLRENNIIHYIKKIYKSFIELCEQCMN